MLGRLAARLDGRHAAPVCLPLPAAHDHESDRVVDQQSSRLHGNLARQTQPGGIDFQFDTAGELWGQWINSQFGEGIITWNTPFLFRTKPEGSRLLICGPANYFKANAHPLAALIESDWISMSFTMNWKIMAPNQPVRFELGEPLFQAIPLATNICADLEQASVSYQKLGDNPELLPPLSGMGPGPSSLPRAESDGSRKAERLAEGLLSRP